MQGMEILFVILLLIFILTYNKTIDFKKFIIDNNKFFELLKEDNYEFLVYSKYGENVDVNLLFQKRITNALTVALVFMVLFMGKFSALNFVIVIVVFYGMYKLPYIQLNSFYKKHLHQIDLMLPYYLKGLEILIQHYTVPVALARSINDAPSVFKPGLKKMIERINSGDSTVDPYMEFANTYPVRDSMRMMRLLYRLGIGSQERKQDRLMMFSRSVSNLQNKAREVKYKERLDRMEGKTMTMLISTGIGVMLILLIAMMNMFGSV
ncbi:MAG: hypothetical protein IK997_04535 [Bacilli bacterium]|nr:hypothetical protein [Bacilli bacterium]